MAHSSAVLAVAGVVRAVLTRDHDGVGINQRRLLDGGQVTRA